MSGDEPAKRPGAVKVVMVDPVTGAQLGEPVTRAKAEKIAPSAPHGGARIEDA